MRPPLHLLQSLLLPMLLLLTLGCGYCLHALMRKQQQQQQQLWVWKSCCWT
jgi:hypothetical protein